MRNNSFHSLYTFLTLPTFLTFLAAPPLGAAEKPSVINPFCLCCIVTAVNWSIAFLPTYPDLYIPVMCWCSTSRG